MNISNDMPIRTYNKSEPGIFALSYFYREHIALGASTERDVVIGNSGSISTEGNAAPAILAATYTSHRISILNSGNLLTQGSGSSGIELQANYDSSGGNVGLSPGLSVHNDGLIRTTGGGGAAGIRASNVAGGAVNISGSGDIHIDNPENSNGHGILAMSNSGDVRVEYSGDITTHGEQSAGILAIAGSSLLLTDDGDVRVTSDEGGSGIIAAAIDGTSVGAQGAGVVVTGDLSSSRAIEKINITNNGDILMHGASSAGIETHATKGATNIENSGIIRVESDGSSGIQAVSTMGGEIGIQNHGTIQTLDASSPGINTVTINGHQRITNDGVLEARGEAADGVSAIDIGSGQIVVENVGGISSTGEDASAIVALSAAGKVSVTNSGQVQGGSRFGAGVVAAGIEPTVSNSGDLSALSDQAVLFYMDDTAAGNASLRNAGKLAGMVQGFGSTVTMENTGLWELRNFADTDGDQVRDTLGVAISDLGNHGENRIDNSGTIALLGDGGLAAALTPEGEYRTGYAANSMSLAGPVQAQLLGVHVFSNSGTLDLSGDRQQVGDVLVISGSQAAGVSGGGVFISNGGQIKLDTVLNEGGANSRSDMLVVDGTSAGSSPTSLVVNNVGGEGAQTVGNGIELVRVLDAGQSANGVFQLSGRLAAGAYEYDLYHGSATTAADGNWYLRSVSTLPPTPQPARSKSPRPETGAYAANLAVAGTMFVHTLHDRLGEPRNAEAEKDREVVPAGWIRVVGGQEKGRAAGGDIDTRTNSQLLHFGSDIAQWGGSGSDQRYLVGVMGSIGHADITAANNDIKYTQNGTRRSASGTVDGYALGMYGTWYLNGDAKDGPYVDSWLQHGWYDSTVKGKGLAGEHYDSNGWIGSIEGGWAFMLGGFGDRQIMLEPQAQVIYSDIQQDSHREQSGTRVNDADASGITTRAGARLLSRDTHNGNAVQPFIEANWWNTDVRNSLDFDAARIGAQTPSSTYELKVGIQGELTSGLHVWGQLGQQWGEDSYRAHEGTVGLRYDF
ncbi:autotransporter outer membrane beta-barrel domain-containing protein [Pseudomonas sp. PDNC002]|uniref:autotransporter family protein n=1 Tax=Pseudomonas sp. PDNC002 TaxID=2811422 RepID=UPI0019633DFB|nr:autotransporter outer membrane beta-barrel domain-containing protein [Pseudomonas sp. PDNC002]QRY82548.1 autotransporter outer membrane beta-barrel domain-containing protein [Pseudomonas sp. PDNC002]